MSDSEPLKEVAPLPWKSLTIRSSPYLYRLIDAHGLAVLFIPGKAGTGTGDRAKEIAEYVLLATNSHEELLEAAKLGRLWMESHPMRPANSLAQIDEAIAKAERG